MIRVRNQLVQNGGYAMNILKKVSIVIISILLVFLISFVLLLLANGGDILALFLNKSLLPPGYNKTNTFLINNLDDLSFISKELSEMDYNHIRIINASLYGEEISYMEVKQNDSSYETVPIPDNLINSIKILFKNGIQLIVYNEGNLNFVLWQTMNESRGIKYGTEPYGEQLIDVKPLSNNNWYYYVHNYEKAKELYPERFK